MAGLQARIEELLRRYGGTARDLAKKSGVSSSYLSTLQSRLRANPDTGINAEEAAKLAAKAGVSVRWLITGEGSPDDAGETPSPRVVHDEEEQLGDEDIPLERMVMWLGVERNFATADIEAARAVAKKAHRWVRRDASLSDIALAYLKAAKAVRTEDGRTDVASVGVRASIILSNASPAAIDSASVDENERARRELDELTNPPAKRPKKG
jgi:transcriptional regulator with XRE-family HTH domain